MHDIGAVVSVAPDLPAVTQPRVTFFNAAAEIDEPALGVLRVFRADVDHAVDRVCAPERRTRPADNFELLDVRHEGALHIPENAGEERRVETATVHQDLKFVRARNLEAAG